MRIVSLLPSATEIVFALGKGDDVVGVTFECDYPAEARSRRVVSTSALPGGLTPAEIDRAVSERIRAGEDLYRLNEGALRDLDAELVLTQDLCAVCAVDVDRVDDALSHLGCRAEVITLDPRSVDEILETIELVGRALGALDTAAALVEESRNRLARVAEAVGRAPRRPTLMLEWTDPPFSAGHWVPEFVTRAGGEALLSNAGGDSQRLDPNLVASIAADVVVVAPCGYHLAAATDIAAASLASGALPKDAEVWAVDADAFFVRPGPRVVDGVELMAQILHPQRCGSPPSDRATRLA